MNNGKDICKYLKEVRKNIADENNIPLEQEECTFEGECNGTCPHCDAEIKYLEEELIKRGKIEKLHFYKERETEFLLGSKGDEYEELTGDVLASYF